MILGVRQRSLPISIRLSDAKWTSSRLGSDGLCYAGDAPLPKASAWANRARHDRAARKELAWPRTRTTIMAIRWRPTFSAARSLSFHTVLVLSAATRPADLQRYAYGPDIGVDSLPVLRNFWKKRLAACVAIPTGCAPREKRPAIAGTA